MRNEIEYNKMIFKGGSKPKTYTRNLEVLPSLKFPKTIKKAKKGMLMEKIDSEIKKVNSKKPSKENKGMFRYYSQGNLHTVTSM